MSLQEKCQINIITKDFVCCSRVRKSVCTLDTSSSINGITTLTFKDKLSQFSRKIKKDPNSFWQSIRDSPKILKYYFPNNEWVTFSHFSSSERKKIKRKKTSDILSGFFCVFLHTILRWLDGHWSIFSIDKESCKKKNISTENLQVDLFRF